MGNRKTAPARQKPDSTRTWSSPWTSSDCWPPSRIATSHDGARRPPRLANVQHVTDRRVVARVAEEVVAEREVAHLEHRRSAIRRLAKAVADGWIGRRQIFAVRPSRPRLPPGGTLLEGLHVPHVGLKVAERVLRNVRPEKVLGADRDAPVHEHVPPAHRVDQQSDLTPR